MAVTALFYGNGFVFVFTRRSTSTPTPSRCCARRPNTPNQDTHNYKGDVTSGSIRSTT